MQHATRSRTNSGRYPQLTWCIPLQAITLGDPMAFTGQPDHPRDHIVGVTPHRETRGHFPGHWVTPLFSGKSAMKLAFWPEGIYRVTRGWHDGSPGKCPKVCRYYCLSMSLRRECASLTKIILRRSPPCLGCAHSAGRRVDEFVDVETLIWWDRRSSL